MAGSERMVSPISVVVAALAVAPSGAAADCDCLCVDGEPQTVCVSAQALRSTPGLCRFRPDVQCTPSAAAGPRRTYDAPVDGVTGCRDASVQSPATGQRITARVCDLDPDR